MSVDVGCLLTLFSCVNATSTLYIKSKVKKSGLVIFSVYSWLTAFIIQCVKYTQEVATSSAFLWCDLHI